MAPTSDELLIIVQGDNVPVGTGGADDDVGPSKLVVQFVPWRGSAVPFACEYLSAFEISIQDDNLFRARVGQVLKCFLGHLASTDDKDTLVVESLENA